MCTQVPGQFVGLAADSSPACPSLKLVEVNKSVHFTVTAEHDCCSLWLLPQFPALGYEAPPKPSTQLNPMQSQVLSAFGMTPVPYLLLLTGTGAVFSVHMWFFKVCFSHILLQLYPVKTEQVGTRNDRMI